jgi:hypothetical protein
MGSINSASSATIMNDVLSSATISAHSMSLTPSDLSVGSNTDGSTTSKADDSGTDSTSDASDTDSSSDDSDLESEQNLQPLLRDDDMSWAEIDDILTKAEKRLHEQQALLNKIASGPKGEPTLQTSNLPAPYTRSSELPARPDASALVPPEMRCLAGQPRVIEDKSFTKSELKKQKKGRTESVPCLLLPDEISQTYLDAEFGLILSAALHI